MKIAGSLLALLRATFTKLDLGHAAVHEEFDRVNESAVFRRQEHHCPGDLIGRANAMALVSLDGGNNPAARGDFDPSKNYEFTLATSAGIDGFSASEFTVDTSGFGNGLAGGSFSVGQRGNNLVLDFTASPAPEPGTWVMVVLGSAGACIWRRRRTRSQGRDQAV